MRTASHGGAPAHRQVRHDDHRCRSHPFDGGDHGRDGGPGAEHATPSARVGEERAQCLQPQGVGVVRAARQDDGRESPRLRRECRDLSEPRAHGFGREVLMADAAPPGLPPPPDSAHGRHHDLVDRRTEAELLRGVVQARSDPSGLHRLRGVEEGVDEAASRLSRLQQEPRAGCGVRGPLASGDLVAHEPELVDRHHGVPAMAAARARGRREVVAPLPRPQRGHRDRQQAARLLDGHETAARTRRHRVLGDHGRSSGGVPADALHRAHGAQLQPTGQGSHGRLCVGSGLVPHHGYAECCGVRAPRQCDSPEVPAIDHRGRCRARRCR